MRALNPHDLVWCVRRLPKMLRDAMKEYGDDIVVAGGFVRACIAREPVNDVDCFCKSKEKAEEFAKKFSKKPYTTDNAYTVTIAGRSVQFIHRWTFDNPQDLIDSFDFTVAQAAFWFAKDNVSNGAYYSRVSDTFYEDLAAKRLIYTSPVRIEEAGGSMLRVLKFYQRGYRIPLDSLGAVIARLVSGVDTTRIAVGTLELMDLPAKGRMEASLARILTALLIEVDPAIDPTHEAHIPSLHPEASDVPETQTDLT